MTPINTTMNINADFISDSISLKRDICTFTDALSNINDSKSIMKIVLMIYDFIKQAIPNTMNANNATMNGGHMINANM